MALLFYLKGVWDNSMKVYVGKCHLMFFSNVKSTNIVMKMDSNLIHESPEGKLLDAIQ